MDFSVIKHFITYSFGALLLRGTTMLMAPINMRKLMPSDYGMLALLNSFVSITTALIGFGLRQVLSIEYFHGNATERKKIINHILCIYVLLATPCITLLLYNHAIVRKYLFLDKVPTYLIILSIGISFFYFFVELFYQVLQYERKALLVTSLQTSIAVLIAVIQIVCLWYFELGIVSIIGPQLLSMIIASGIGLYVYMHNQYNHHVHVHASVQCMPMYIKQGLPFIPSVLFGWILASIDRWILAQQGSMHDVGIYAIADTFGQLFNMLVLYPWSGSYLPYIMNTYATNQDNLLAVEQKNQRVMYIAMASMSILVTLGYFASKPLLRIILPPAYHTAINYIWIILMGYIFLMGSYFAASFIQFHKKSYFLAFALCLPALLNIVLNYALIPFFGLYGCTLATLCSYAAYFAFTLGYNFVLQKRIKEERPSKHWA